MTEILVWYGASASSPLYAVAQLYEPLYAGHLMLMFAPYFSVIVLLPISYQPAAVSTTQCLFFPDPS